MPVTNIRPKLADYIKHILAVNLLCVFFSCELIGMKGTGGTQEAFVRGDISLLERRAPRQTGESVHRIDDDNFDVFFPIHSPAVANDRSFFAGRITESEDETPLGSGVLLDIISSTNDSIRVRGVTALHIFFLPESFNPIENAVFHIRIGTHGNGVNGAVAAAASSAASSSHSASYNYARVNIDKLFVPRPPKPIKDICFFEGEIRGISSQVRSELSQLFTQSRPSAPNTLANDSQQLVIYHYPVGVREQRINTGWGKCQTGRHLLRTVDGSSGAALWSQTANKVVGIHVGASDIKGSERTLEISGYPKVLKVAEFNLFVPLLQEDVDGITSESVELYNGSWTPTLRRALGKILKK